jgi:hypothetical protein
MPEHSSNPRPSDDDSLIQGKNWLSKRIESLIASVTPKCTQVTRLLSDELDHPLPYLTRLRLRLHFVICTYCKRYKIQLRLLRELLSTFHQHSHEIAGPNLPPAASDRIREVLHRANIDDES